MLGSVAVIGTGEKALNLAEQIAGSGEFQGVTVFGREPEPPSHTLFARDLARYVYGLEPFHPSTMAVFIAVADEGVPETAFSVAGQGPAPDGCAAFHVSPTLPTDALAPLHAQGYALGVFHVFVGGRGGYVAVTGSPRAVSVARSVADTLDAEVLEVPVGRRPLVDAASVLVSGCIEPLVALSTRLMERAGITADEATPALLAAARSVLDRIEQGPAHDSLDHPVREGDFERAALHLRALDAEDQRLYALLAAELLRLDDTAIDEETRGAMDRLLDRYLTEVVAIPESVVAGDSVVRDSPDADEARPDPEHVDPQPTSVG